MDSLSSQLECPEPRRFSRDCEVLFERRNLFLATGPLLRAVVRKPFCDAKRWDEPAATARAMEVACLLHPERTSDWGWTGCPCPARGLAWQRHLYRQDTVSGVCLSFGYFRGPTRRMLVCGVLDHAASVAKPLLLGNHYVRAELQKIRLTAAFEHCFNGTWCRECPSCSACHTCASGTTSTCCITGAELMLMIG